MLYCVYMRRVCGRRGGAAHASAGRRDTAPDTGRGGRTETPVGRGCAAAPSHRERHGHQPHFLRALWHRQDHRGQHHRQAGEKDPVLPERHHRVLAGCEERHRRCGHHAGTQRRAAVSGRDPVFQQEAAAEPAGVSGERQDHHDRLYYGESVFLHLQRAAVPQHRVRVQASDGGGDHPRRGAGAVHRKGAQPAALHMGGRCAPHRGQRLRRRCAQGRQRRGAAVPLGKAC